MPYELSDFSTALRFLERSPDQNLMLIRSLRLGPRPGFAAIVDNRDEMRALMLIHRPNWKMPGSEPTRVQIEAADPRSAVALLSWLPPVAHVQLYSYRPWLQDLVRTIFVPEEVDHKVHCLAHRRQFRPSQLQSLVVEISPDQPELRRQAEEVGGLRGTDRLFGIIQDGEVVAWSALARPDTDYVSVQGVYTRRQDRQQGFGSAVLSAATQAGLDSGKVVSYGLPVEDVPSLHLVAGLGFAPACREWMLEGYPQR
ncbi:MAG: GNAT family N-acetyltransferase [Bacillota bacterium]